MKIKFRSLAALLILSVYLASMAQFPVLAQADTGSISGRITNVNGDPLSYVTVRAARAEAPCDLSKQPIMLVHSWGDQEQLSDDSMGFLHLYQYMNEDGYVLDCNLFFASGVRALKSAEENRQAISASMRRAFSLYKAVNPGWRGHFDMLGHSYGGLNARFYLESGHYLNDRQQFGIYVDNLVTLGTPHGGVQIPTELYEGAAIIGIDALFPLSKESFLSTYQLLDTTMFDYNLRHRQPDGTCYRLIGGDFLKQENVPWYIQGLYGKYQLISPGDAGVSLRSAREMGINPLLKQNYPRVVVVTTPDLHGYLNQMGLGGLQSYVYPQYTYNQVIRPNLGKPLSACVNLNQAGLSASVQAGEGFVSPIEVSTGVLDESETETGPIPVDWTGSTHFTVVWEGGDLDLTLLDEIGNPITPDVAEYDPNIDYVKEIGQGRGLASYLVQNAQPGSWTYNLAVPGGADSVAYELYVYPQTTLSVMASAQAGQSIGEPVIVEATVADDVAAQPGAVVTALITRPDRSTSDLNLSDNGITPDQVSGDGVYSAFYPSTGLGGVYLADVTAQGVYQSFAYRRTTRAAFTVTPDLAQIVGGIADRSIDDDANGLNEFLEVDFNISVIQAGSFSLSAVLQGAAGEYIDLANAEFTFDSPGTYTFPLRFSGKQIKKGRVNGPFTVAQVALLQDGTFIQLDDREIAGQTAAYDYLSFGDHYEVFLPLVTFTMPETLAPSIASPSKAAQNSFADFVYTTRTDWNGNYSFTNLPAGQYTITASQTGYYFLPIKRRVNLPPNATFINFTRSSVNPGEMISVGAGTFRMGCDPGRNNGYTCPSSELPLHTVYLNAFLIDKTEVSNAQYSVCVAAGGCAAPRDNSSYARASYYNNPAYANYPVLHVSWYDARAYCSWTGKRLLSEAEWEKAARGTTPRAFPWGYAGPTCSLANFYYNDDCVGDTAAVNSYPGGASPYGVLNMAGNVYEWVNDWFQAGYYGNSPSNNPPGPSSGTMKVIRGGAWDNSYHSMRTAARNATGPDYFVAVFDNIGFRCASDP